MTDRVSVTTDLGSKIGQDTGVAEVRLNRPEKLNALDLGMFRAIGDAIIAVSADPEIRCVVLSGEGRGFCAGADMSLLSAVVEDGAPAGNLGEHQRKHSWLLEVPKPILDPER